MTDTQKTIDVKEAAQILGVSNATAYRAASRGELPSIRLGRRLLVLREPFEQLLAGKTQNPNKEADVAS
ncbi:MAG TPA: helix-turn-helix domain-containing protein [Symbiobacteriaceae bacterium]|nr:helix-turn-helix domain-containing protein [Symbiobacteriaceae bacterium]